MQVVESVCCVFMLLTCFFCGVGRLGPKDSPLTLKRALHPASQLLTTASTMLKKGAEWSTALSAALHALTMLLLGCIMESLAVVQCTHRRRTGYSILNSGDYKDAFKVKDRRGQKLQDDSGEDVACCCKGMFLDQTL